MGSHVLSALPIHTHALAKPTTAAKIYFSAPHASAKPSIPITQCKKC